MVDEAFVDDPLADTNVWDRTIELSELNNRVEDTFLSEGLNINNVLGYNVSDDTKLDIVHEPVLPPIKEELPDLKDYIDDNEDIQNSQEIKSEPLEGVHTDNRIEISDYLENDDVVVQKEIIYVNCMRTDHISGVTSTELNKLDCGILCSHCETCNEDYKWYCYKCSMLSYILDQSIIDRSEDRAKKTVPTFLTIKKALLGHVGVYSLKYIPKNVKFGPFEGLDPIQTTSGCAWKLKYGVLTVAPDNVNRSNWMQYVDSAKLSAEQNLTIFQQDGKLYFRSSRQINPGDELLVYYGDTLNAGGSDVQSYCYPAAESHMETVYACTYCCLGFSSEVYLHKHKTVCPNTENKDMTKGSVQCAFCKIYLDMRENSEYHMRHCCVKYTWMENDHAEGDDDRSKAEYSCTKCDFKTSDVNSMQQHSHEKPRPYKCKLCEDKQFTTRKALRLHTKDKHTKVHNKEFKCTECSYQTNHKTNLQKHVFIHKSTKQFRCSVCDKQFRLKEGLRKHYRNFHETPVVKKFECEVNGCSYRTNKRENLKQHLYVHEDLKSFVCTVCNRGFNRKPTMMRHIKDKHMSAGDKRFKCAKCNYQTNFTSSFSRHSATHEERAPILSRDFKCDQCDYETHRKEHLQRHMYVHTYAKPFMCELCDKGFTQKTRLKLHVTKYHNSLKYRQKLIEVDEEGHRDEVMTS